MNNLHISLTNLKNESRVLKETNSLSVHNIFNMIYIVGLHEDGVELEESIDKKRLITRIKLKSRILPKNLFSQSLKYLEFTFQVLYKYRKKNIKVVNIHSLGLLPVGILFKFFYKTKLIYDAHEYETEIQGLMGVRKKLSKIIEKTFIKYCDKTIVVSESIANEYKRLYPNLSKPSVVLNTPIYKKIEKKDLFREKLGIATNKTIFLYQGNLSRGRGIETLIETFKDLNANNQQLTTNNIPCIVFMGYGPLEETIKQESKQHENIYFYPAVNPDILLDYTSSADFGISTIEDSCLSYRYCLPNKMFEYLMAEIPVIVSNLDEMKRLVKENGIGVVAKENTPTGLKKAIEEIVMLNKTKLQKNIQKVKHIYNWEEQEKVLLQIYKEL